MTLEEIKAEIKKRFNDEISSKRGMPNDFVDGICFGYAECLKMLNQLEPSWHPYPAEKPTEDGYYQVTFDDSTVDLARWKDGSWTFNPKIIAWKEKDKPYKKEEPNG